MYKRTCVNSCLSVCVCLCARVCVPARVCVRACASLCLHVYYVRMYVLCARVRVRTCVCMGERAFASSKCYPAKQTRLQVEIVAPLKERHNHCAREPSEQCVVHHTDNLSRTQLRRHDEERERERTLP